MTLWEIVSAPWKINMEPENTPLEKENHLPNHHFQVLCWSSRVCISRNLSITPWRGTALSLWTASIGSISMWGAVRNRFPLGENTSNSTTIVGWKMDHERLAEVLGYIIYVISENWGILKATLVDENVLVPLKECNGRVMKGLKPFQYRTATLVISRDPNLNLYFRLLLRVNHVGSLAIVMQVCWKK